MNPVNPVVTALTVTRGRLPLGRSAIEDFRLQTYPHRRLLILTDGGDEEADAYRAETKFDDRIGVLSLPKEAGKSLGELRNIALASSPSDWTIQWDDDDRYHPERISSQVLGITPGVAAVFLREQLHRRESTNEVAWVRAPHGGVIEGTILYNRRFPLRYPHLRRAEDSVLSRGLENSRVSTSIEGGILYCRIYHGTNTWDEAHHLDRMTRLGISEDELLQRSALLQEASRVYRWPENWRLLAKRS